MTDGSLWWKRLALRALVVLVLVAIAWWIGERPEEKTGPNAAGPNATDGANPTVGSTESPSRTDDPGAGASKSGAEIASDDGGLDDPQASAGDDSREADPPNDKPATRPAAPKTPSTTARTDTTTPKAAGTGAPNAKANSGSTPPKTSSGTPSKSDSSTSKANPASATAATTPTTPTKPSGRTNEKPATPADSGKVKPKAGDDFIVRGQVIRDQSDRVVYRGDIDLTPTLERIRKGVRNEHRNDGSTFQNREGRLPRRSDGYYKEYVHPTPGLGGPGPQRVIIGKEGETYYTADHYRSFKKIR